MSADIINILDRRRDAVTAPVAVRKNDRKEDWLAATARLEYWTALLKLCDIAWRADRVVPGASKYIVDDDGRWRIVEEIRRAQAALLLTPAPTRGDLKIKQAFRASDRLCHVDVNVTEVDALIAADDAWLRATVSQRRRRRAAE